MPETSPHRSDTDQQADVSSPETSFVADRTNETSDADQPATADAPSDEVSPVAPAVPAPSPTELIEQCQGLVRSIARQIHLSLPGPSDLDDLIGYGQVGLAEAARVFNPNANVKFSTFAYYRVRGAIFDGISKMAWFRKPSASQSRFDQGANAVLEENASASSNSPADDAIWLADMSRTLAVAYLTTHSSSLDVADDDSEDPAAVAADHELASRLHDLIERLPREAADLVRSVYFEGLTLQEAGERLGISKSWASRLHSRILDRLGRELRRLGAS